MDTAIRRTELRAKEKLSLEESTELRGIELEMNRGLGVFSTPAATKDVVYEVIDGRHHLPDGRKLGPGMRFHPTPAQVAKNTLRGKVRELTAREVRDLAVPVTRTQVNGADVGIRELPLTGSVLKLALEHQLTVEDFASEEPEGAGGGYTKAQVERIIAGKGN